MYTAIPIADATAIVVPSPDNSEFSIAVVLPSITSAQLQPSVSPTLQFRLICGLDTLENNTTLSCKVYQHYHIVNKLPYMMNTCIAHDVFANDLYTEMFSVLLLSDGYGKFHIFYRTDDDTICI